MNTPLTRKKDLIVRLAACISMLTLAACQPKSVTDTQDLITERQECYMKDTPYPAGGERAQTVAIDIPIGGPQTLVDSVLALINEELYAYFDNYTYSPPSDSLLQNDVRTLIERYRDHYAPLFADSLTEYDFTTDCLELNLVAQTDSYVTYAVNYIHYGEGIEVSTDWITFAKSDGHRLKKIISEEEMARFYAEHPDQRSEDVWANEQRFHEENNRWNIVCSVGLLNDSLAHQYCYAAGIYEDLKYPLDVIAPYLTEEAQRLIENK